MRPQGQPILSPRIEMIPRSDRATHTLRSPHRPKLRKGRRPDDRWCIGSNRGIDIICASVGGNLALVGAAAAGVVCTVRLDDVVFNQGVSGPAVHS